MTIYAEKCIIDTTENERFGRLSDSGVGYCFKSLRINLNCFGSLQAFARRITAVMKNGKATETITALRLPYVVCHMTASVDGKVTGDFLFRSECESATEIYYEINRQYKKDGYNGFICGRTTMEESFARGWYPELSEYAPVTDKADHIPEVLSGFYAIAFDPKGKLGWRNDRIIDPDGDPGYDKAQIVEVLTEQADKRYLSYLRQMRIPYIIAGESTIDVAAALNVLCEKLGAEKLLLEGGSTINGYFLRANCVDELSLVLSPVIAGETSKPLFADAVLTDFTLTKIKKHKDGVLRLIYKR